MKTLVGGYRDSYRQVKRTRLWGFTAVNVHHTAQNISKELTQKILNVLATVTPGRCYLVIAMCTYIKTPIYSVDEHRHVKNVLGPGNVVQLRVLSYSV